MEYLQHILDTTTTPFWTAVILGLMTAISPCPLATNITAIGFLSKDIESRKTIFLNGLVYTIGRAVSYSVLGILLYLGASRFHMAGFFQKYGEYVLGPFLIIIGLFMLDLIRISFPGMNRLSDAVGSKNWGWWRPLLLGLILALAFCPYSGMLFFGMLVPLTVSSSSGLLLPIVYALATGLPVVIVAWILAFSVAGISRFYNNMKKTEKWVRMITACLFIVVGLYYIYIYYIQ